MTGRARIKKAHRWLLELVNLEKPTIAAVNGVTAGIGCNLALACDLIYASDQARFSQAFVKIGLNQNPVRLQLVANDGESFLNGPVDIQRSSYPSAHLEMRPDIIDQDVRPLSVAQHALQRFPDVVQIRLDAIEPIQSGARAGDDRRQWLFDLVDH